MIHVMYDELERLAKTLIGKVSKSKSVSELGVCKSVLEGDHLRPAKDLKLDDRVTTELSTVSTPSFSLYT